METYSCSTSLRTIRILRVSLVDDLEGHIDSLLEVLVRVELFTRDDREEVLGQPGPRARVRKVLDLLECKGEEAARTFLSVWAVYQREAQTSPEEGNSNLTQSAGTKSDHSRSWSVFTCWSPSAKEKPSMSLK